MSESRVCTYCGRTADEVTKFHRFPTNPQKVQEWLTALGINFYGKVSPSWKLCNFHFNKDQYESLKDLRLKATALPAPNGPCVWWAKMQSTREDCIFMASLNLLECKKEPPNNHTFVSDSEDPLKNDTPDSDETTILPTSKPRSPKIQLKPKKVRSVKIFDETGLMDICRICSKPVELTAMDAPTLVKTLKFIIPELDLNMYPNPCICDDCCPPLNEAFNLKKLCLSTETLLSQAITSRPIRDKDVILFPPFDFKPNENEAPSTEPEPEMEELIIEINTTKADDEVMMEEDSVNPTICDICGRKYHDPVAFNRHMKRHQLIDYFCEECGVHLKKVSSSEKHKHILSHKEYPCDKCPKVFKNPKYLRTHKVVHGPDNEKYTNCEKCGQRITKMNIKRHMLGHYPELNNLECTGCGKMFPTKSLLNTHSRHMCGGRAARERGVRCVFCNERFETRLILRQHHADKHDVPDRPYCKQCDLTFSNNSILQTHFKTRRHSLKLVQVRKPQDKISVTDCHLCEKKFPYPFGLKAHLKHAHQEAQYKCDYCDKVFRYEVSLERHWVKVHGIKGEFECSECSSAYFSERALKGHIIIKHADLIPTEGTVE